MLRVVNNSWHHYISRPLWHQYIQGHCDTITFRTTVTPLHSGPLWHHYIQGHCDTITFKATVYTNTFKVTVTPLHSGPLWHHYIQGHCDFITFRATVTPLHSRSIGPPSFHTSYLVIGTLAFQDTVEQFQVELKAFLFKKASAFPACWIFQCIR